MVGAREWTYPYTTRIAQMLQLRITGQFGSERNLGSTPNALRSILSKFKHVRMFIMLCSITYVKLCYRIISYYQWPVVNEVVELLESMGVDK